MICSYLSFGSSLSAFLMICASVNSPLWLLLASFAMLSNFVMHFVGSSTLSSSDTASNISSRSFRSLFAVSPSWFLIYSIAVYAHPFGAFVDVLVWTMSIKSLCKPIALTIFLCAALLFLTASASSLDHVVGSWAGSGSVSHPSFVSINASFGFLSSKSMVNCVTHASASEMCFSLVTFSWSLIVFSLLPLLF